MPILVSNQIQYKFNNSEITKLIANDLGESHRPKENNTKI